MKILSKANLGVIFFIPLAIMCIPSVSRAASSVYERKPEVKIFSGLDFTLEKKFSAYAKDFTSGMSIATGDVNADGETEIITGAGVGSGSTVKIFTNSGKLIGTFAAFSKKYKKGIVVAAGNIDGEGKQEIIVGTRAGAAPQVKVFDDKGKEKFNFFAFDRKFRGGVLVSSGDIDANGKDEIIVGAGPTGGPHVRVFNETGKWTGTEFFPFSDQDHGGVSVAAGDIDADGKDEVVTAMFSSGEAWVKVYKADKNKTIVGKFLAFSKSFKGGINIACGDMDNDGKDEIIAAANLEGKPRVKIFEASGSLLAYVDAYEKSFKGGVWISSNDIDRDGDVEILASPGKKYAEGRIDLHKYIDVDLSEQVLRAYEDGYLKFKFLTSTGTAKYPTPEGSFEVKSKVKSARMSHEYGPNHPDNYDLANVPNILSFFGGYTIHGAYWHHNFGHRMSHGCVNLSVPDSAKIYPWADLGTPVLVHQ